MSRAWVIGGTSGIGKACAELLKKDYVVAATGYQEFDVQSSIGDWRDILHELQFPTHIVYAAGINHLDYIGSMNNLVHQEVIKTNLFGFINLMEALVDAGKRTGPWRSRGNYPDPLQTKPSVVAISSDAAERPLRTSIGYCASKAGLNMAVKVAARELGPFGWRINAVSPGMTAGTGMTDYIDERVPQVRGWTHEEAEAYECSQEVVPGRIEVREVAQVVKSTLEGPAHLNGSIITINGGR